MKINKKFRGADSLCQHPCGINYDQTVLPSQYISTSLPFVHPLSLATCLARSIKSLTFDETNIPSKDQGFYKKTVYEYRPLDSYEGPV